MTTREGGLDVKYKAYGGGIRFSLIFANWKSSGRVVRVQIINTDIGITLTNLPSLRWFDAMNCCFSICHAEGKEWLCYIC